MSRPINLSHLHTLPPARFGKKWALLVMGWLCLVSWGAFRLNLYASQPGLAGIPPKRWPVATALHANPNSATLLVFAHPLCPCTRSTLRELSVIVAQARQPVAVTVLIYQPSQPPPDWVRGDLWDLAAAIPGVTVMADLDGVESKRFDAETSGWTVLYDAQGRLQFAGGITDGRGHEGNNAGRSSVLAHLVEPSATGTSGAVFGCSLFHDRPVASGEGSQR